MTCATNLIPGLRKPLDHIFLTFLPEFEGIRPNNVLIASATNSLPVSKTLLVSVEGYNRFLSRHSHYGEYWFLIRERRSTRAILGIFVLNDSTKRVVLGLGGRIFFLLTNR